MDRQVPLGYNGEGPAELRTEISSNVSVPELRQQVVGNVFAETVGAPTEGLQPWEFDNFREGDNGTSQCVTAPR